MKELNKTKVKKNVVWVTVAIAVVAAALFFFTKKQRQLQPDASHAGQRSITTELPTTRSVHINEVLQQWSTGHKNEAINGLLQMTEAHLSVADYRPYDFSEEQFISLPEAKRNKLKQEMIARFKIVRELVREIDRRIKVSISSGDYAAAGRLLAGMKQIGLANTGPHVTLLAGLFGKMINDHMDEGLTLLEKARSSDVVKP